MSVIDLGLPPDDIDGPLLQRIDPRVRMLACAAFALLCVSLNHVIGLEFCLVLACACDIDAVEQNFAG